MINPTPVFDYSSKNSTVHPPNQLFVGGLPKHSTNKSLYDYFSQFGKVSEARIVLDKITQVSRGFAYITFSHPKSIQNVFSIPRHIFLGSPIAVKNALSKETTESITMDETERKVFIVNLPVKATHDDLKKYFSQFGEVERVELKAAKRFAFLLFRYRLSVNHVFNHDSPHLLLGTEIECRPVLKRSELNNLKVAKTNLPAKSKAKPMNDEKREMPIKNPNLSAKKPLQAPINSQKPLPTNSGPGLSNYNQQAQVPPKGLRNPHLAQGGSHPQINERMKESEQKTLKYIIGDSDESDEDVKSRKNQNSNINNNNYLESDQPVNYAEAYNEEYQYAENYGQDYGEEYDPQMEGMMNPEGFYRPDQNGREHFYSDQQRQPVTLQFASQGQQYPQKQWGVVSQGQFMRIPEAKQPIYEQAKPHLPSNRGQRWGHPQGRFPAQNPKFQQNPCPQHQSKAMPRSQVPTTPGPQPANNPKNKNPFLNKQSSQPVPQNLSNPPQAPPPKLPEEQYQASASQNPPQNEKNQLQNQLQVDLNDPENQPETRFDDEVELGSEEEAQEEEASTESDECEMSRRDTTLSQVMVAGIQQGLKDYQLQDTDE